MPIPAEDVPCGQNKGSRRLLANKKQQAASSKRQEHYQVVSGETKAVVGQQIHFPSPVLKLKESRRKSCEKDEF
jgi:hypothetical protein